MTASSAARPAGGQGAIAPPPPMAPTDPLAGVVAAPSGGGAATGQPSAGGQGARAPTPPMAPIAPSGENGSNFENGSDVAAPGGGAPDEARNLPGVVLESGGEARAESTGDRLAVGLGLGTSATRGGEETPGPSCPQPPAGGLSTWSCWTCNQSTLPRCVRQAVAGGECRCEPRRHCGTTRAARAGELLALVLFFLCITLKPSVE